MDYTELLNQLNEQFPGIATAYENAVAEGFTGSPQDYLNQFMSNFPSGGLQYSPAEQTYLKNLNQQVTAPAQLAATTAPNLLGATPQPNMVDPRIAAYQRSLLSGTNQPSQPYGYGIATSPYVGYPRNPFSGLLY